MVSARSAKILAWLPFQLLYAAIKHFVPGLVPQFRKYRNNLLVALKLVAIRAILRWDILDGAIFNKTGVGAVMQDVARSHLDLVRNVPSFGKRFLERAYWLVEQPNRSPEDPVIIYCHGGGYFLQANSEQVENILATYCLLSPEKRNKLSILVLDYRLACDGHTFPSQMNDLHQLYSTLRQTSSRIGLIGDSAGGNLAVGYTQYLKQQNAPKDDYPLLLALISPWLSIFPDEDTLDKDSSYVVNADGDMVPSVIDDHKRQFIFGEEDRFSLIWSPATKVPASTKDWTSIPTYNDPRRKIFLLAGEDETLRDDSIWFANYALGANWDFRNYSKTRSDYSVDELEYKTANVEAYVEPLGVHDAVLIIERPLAAVEEGKLVEELNDQEFFGTKRLVRFLEGAI